jgi:hypothetical protein
MPLRTRDPQKKMEIRAGRLQKNGSSQSSEPKNWPSLKTCWGHTVAMLALTWPRPCQALQALSVVALPVYIPKDSAWQIEAAGRMPQRVRLPCRKIPRNGTGSVRDSQRMASRQSSDAKGIAPETLALDYNQLISRLRQFLFVCSISICERGVGFSAYF